MVGIRCLHVCCYHDVQHALRIRERPHTCTLLSVMSGTLAAAQDAMSVLLISANVSNTYAADQSLRQGVEPSKAIP